jgi:Carboxypeptidase regulatory-like domain
MSMVLLALTAAWASTASPRPEARGTVEGVVTGVATGLALSNVEVKLSSADALWNIVRTTNAEGTFSFSGIPAGVYRLEAWQEGYVEATVGSVFVIPGIPVSEHLQLDTTAAKKPAAPQPRGATNANRT